MGRRKMLAAAEDLLYQLEENCLPMITLSDDRAAVRKQARKLRKLVEAEKAELAKKQLAAAEADQKLYNPLVPLRWEEREVQRRVRTAKIPFLSLTAWCKAQGIDVEEFEGRHLQEMLDQCVETSKGWQLGYEEWKTTDYGFVDLHMGDVSGVPARGAGPTMDGPAKEGGA